MPQFETNTVKISVPENVELGSPLYAANAIDKDSGKNGIVMYRLSYGGSTQSSSQISSNSMPSNNNLFNVDARSGHLTLAQHLDYETLQRHTLIVTATDSGEPALSTNLTILVEVQDGNKLKDCTTKFV